MNFWTPENFLNCDRIKNSPSYAIIVLNRPISAEKDLIECLWNHGENHSVIGEEPGSDLRPFLAAFRITVDGGTNRWLRWLRRHNLDAKLEQPNLITGDMDSCSEESIAFFHRSRVIPTVDQDETDFTKSLRVLAPYIAELALKNVVVLCETSGRMDQILANINTLFKNQQQPPQWNQLPAFILSANSLSWLLSEGRHTIDIPETVKNFWCALVPFEPTTVTTAGLKWNLQDHVLRFGGMVSTSNKYDSTADTVEVTTDKPVLWSMGISAVDDK